ncbi:hypothetical protein CYPRO_3038 [Cyclonatronum proteinivorum]|uniref:Uncharacterized protein n=1 Tax=Cyclonatronum proteinivorum TaxID=1457365 RepID=A0A345UP73_9BACT|nr:hypothetical protein CYPRO_3038 [Cyclonatronum proteinivorum]
MFKVDYSYSRSAGVGCKRFSIFRISAFEFVCNKEMNFQYKMKVVSFIFENKLFASSLRVSYTLKLC